MEYVFTLGNWKSIEELEDSVTLEELHRLFLAQQRREYRERAFAASLQGVELPAYDDPDYEDVTTFDELKQRVAARQAEAMGGKKFNEFEDFGISVEEY